MLLKYGRAGKGLNTVIAVAMLVVAVGVGL